MNRRHIITIFVLLIIVFAFIATVTSIFIDTDGVGFKYESIRGESIQIYGKGLYRHMSADVAIQGIAQDYITLFIGLPLLLISLYFYRKGNFIGKIVLTGGLLYIFISYLIYLTMGMYNYLFLVYVTVVAMAFISLGILLVSFDLDQLDKIYAQEKTMKYSGVFLIVNSILIAFLWLNVVVPPLFKGTIYPEGLDHYTTLIVQGLDLSLFLPISFVSGYLAVKKNKYGYLFSLVQLIFLFLLMIALTSKLLFMRAAGQSVIPAIFIMPTISLLSMSFAFRLLKKLQMKSL